MSHSWSFIAAALVAACGASVPSEPPAVIEVSPAAAGEADPGADRSEVRVEMRRRTLPHPRADIAANLPVLSSGDGTLQRALDAVNAKVDKAADNAMQAIAGVATNDASQIADDLRYYLELSCEVPMATPRLVSILCVLEIFSGGAHPNRFFESHNFTIDGGGAHEIVVRTLTGGEQRLQALALRASDELRKKGASGVEDGPLPTYAMAIFTIERGGLHLHFAPNVAGAYVEGAYDVLLPWPEAEQFLGRSALLEPIRALAR